MDGTPWQHPHAGSVPPHSLGAPPAVVVCAQLPTSHGEQAILPVLPQSSHGANGRSGSEALGQVAARAAAVSWEIRCWLVSQQGAARSGSKGVDRTSAQHGRVGRELGRLAQGSLQPWGFSPKAGSPEAQAGAGGLVLKLWLHSWALVLLCSFH